METGQETQVNGPGSYEDMLSKLKIKPDVSTTASAPKEEEVIEEEEVEETVVEPEVTGAAIEAPKTEPASTDTEPEKKTIFEINEFNQTFATEYENEEALKSALADAKRIGELQEQIKELESLREENLLLKENLDPMKYFASEDDYKVAQFKKQFPDKDASVAYKLMTADLSTMSDRDLIAQNLLLDNPDLDGGLKGALEIVDDKYGIEDGVDIDALTKNKMKVEARSSRKNIESVKAQIQLPDKIDPSSLAAKQKELLEQKTNKLKEGWSAIGKEAAKSLPDLVIKDKDADGNEVEAFRYSMTKDFPQEVVDNMINYMALQGIEPSKETASVLMDTMQKEYLFQHREDIIKAVRDDALAKAEERRLKKQHNTGEPTKEVTPVTDKSKDDTARLMADLKKGWSPHQFVKK